MGNAEPSSAVRQILRSDAMRTALAVVELGSVRGAAAALSMTPSAVSKQLRKMEEQLGRTLFVRSRDGIAPNGEGLALAGYARRFLALVAEVGERFETELGGVRVRLGVPEDVGLARVPSVLARCADLAPAIEVELTVGGSAQLIGLVEARTLDLAVLSDGGPGFPADATPLCAEPMAWIGRRGAVASSPLPIAVAPEGCAWRVRALAALAQAGARYRIVCTSPSAVGRLAAARLGIALAPLPASLADGEAALEVVRAGLPPLPPGALALYRPAGGGRSVRAVADALRDAYAPTR